MYARLDSMKEIIKENVVDHQLFWGAKKKKKKK